jgi:hypothetical protein
MLEKCQYGEVEVVIYVFNVSGSSYQNSIASNTTS